MYTQTALTANDDLKALIRTIPDFPKPGIAFRDITALLLDGPGFATCIDRLTVLADAMRPDMIAAVEARGFLFGAGVAKELGIGVLPIRKRGKLPGKTVGVDYALEYGTDRLEMHLGDCNPATRVLIVDDLLATGGTVAATAQLLRGEGAEVAGALFVIDLPDLGGGTRLRADGIEVATLMAFEGE